MLTQEWNIQSRSLQCAATGRRFEKGERIYSALYWRDGQYQRTDLCEEAWKSRNENIAPLSAWQTEFVPPPPPEPEPLKKDDAESLLRRLMGESTAASRNARYILALMLERKKVLRQIERQKQEGTTILVYEHIPSSEVWLIEDPGLKLSELTAVQDEVAHLLGPSGTVGPDAAAVAPTPEAAAEPAVEPKAE